MSEERTFTAKVQALGRIAIPKVVMESLDLKEGDFVEVRIKKIMKKLTSSEKEK
ncbi:MAG: hypothetical protein ACP5KW_10685 [Thermoproteota archaeon]